LDIKVRGTSFNVRSCPDEDILETTLVQGKLQLSTSEKEAKKKTAWRLNENEQFIYSNKADSSQLIKMRIPGFIPPGRKATTNFKRSNWVASPKVLRGCMIWKHSLRM